MNTLDILVHWITERDAIRERKADSLLPQEWTNDVLLRHYRFCNVDREDDKVTKWIDANIRKPYASHPALWFNLALSRYINKIESLEHMGFVCLWRRKGRDWTDKMKELPTPFGPAYIIPTGQESMPKLDWLAKYLFTPLWEGTPPDGELDSRTCQGWFDWLWSHKGCGEFMANQIVTDMKYTRYLESAVDRKTFVCAGPGTKRGLNRLLGYDLGRNWTPEEGRIALVQIRDRLLKNYKFSPHVQQALERDLNNLSNCFCEYDKYCRALLDEGRPKQRYTP